MANGAIDACNVRIIAGTKVINVNKMDYAVLFTKQQVEELLGITNIELSKLTVAVTNGDWNAAAIRPYGTMVQGLNVAFLFTPVHTGNIRVNYTLIYPR